MIADEIRKYVNLLEDAEEYAAEYDQRLEADKSYVLEQMGHLFPDMEEMPDAFYEEAADALRSICGRFVGHGVFRAVYEHRTRNDLVIKIEGGATDFPTSNIRESELWDYADGNEDLSVWFAPVILDSPAYWVIQQQKTEDWNWQSEEFPNYVPSFFRDADIWKPEQWGKLDNRIVCRDYGGMDGSSLAESWEWVAVEVDNGVIHFKEADE